MESDSSESSCSPGVDVQTSLEVIVGDAGSVLAEYGGFRITVLDHTRFPWYDLFNLLLSGECFEVWVHKRNSNIEIDAKPTVE